MEHRPVVERDIDPAQKIHPDMPNHAANEAEFLALVNDGVADIEAGRTVQFETVAAKLRRKMYGRA